MLETAGRKVLGYDKKGDNHYDNISAFIKSMRGGDAWYKAQNLARRTMGLPVVILGSYAM